MPRAPISLAVVGANFPNRRGPGRRFEIEICKPGEPVLLVPEPKNPADPRAIAVFSCRDVQLGYLTAERCVLIHKALREGADVTAVFQEKMAFGAKVRVTFDGSAPVLPPPVPGPSSEEPDFYPDPEWPEE